MVTQEMKNKYAKLLVRKGVNIQEGQPLSIRANVRDAEFVRLCVKEAYEAGASYVEVNWSDDIINKLDYENQTLEELKTIPQWIYDKMKYGQDRGICYLTLSSSKPGLLKDVDPEKINAHQSAYSTKIKDLRHYTMASEGQWCIAGLPSVEWAKVVFPELSDDEAFDKLESAIFSVSRVTRDNDPMADWEEHDEKLEGYARKLNENDFKELRFTNDLGTDLTVSLVENHIWGGGRAKTPKGIAFDANIPTEEVFCMPKRDEVNGIVYASKPLAYNGKVIDGFWFKFKDGEVVEFAAEKEQETLRQLLEFDDGAKRLGEVALVPYDSPVSNTNMLFFDTLYDENAACHLALGASYPENLKGAIDMSEEEMELHGANQSMQHEDFMFGTKDMHIDGICKDGTVVPIFREGNFVL